MPPDTAAATALAAAAPSVPPGRAGREPLATLRLAVAGPLADPEPDAPTDPVELDRPDRRARRRRTLVLIGLVVLGLVATATLMVAGEMFLRGPTTHTIPFLSGDAANGPIVEPRHHNPGKAGKGGTPAAPSSPSHQPSTAPSATSPATPPSATHQPESANGAGQPGMHWVCTVTRRGFSCVPVAGPSAPASPAPSWSWSDRHDGR